VAMEPRKLVVLVGLIRVREHCTFTWQEPERGGRAAPKSGRRIVPSAWRPSESWDTVSSPRIKPLDRTAPDSAVGALG
jgi:hypothetical protein